MSVERWGNNNKIDMKKSIAFAYYADGKFIGWYADSFGSIRNAPKLYSFTESQLSIIQANLTSKLKRIAETSFDVEKENKKGLAALSLAVFDSEELLRGKEVELRVVECPEYDGENPDFDVVAYEKALNERQDLMKQEGVLDIPAPSRQRTDAVQEFNKKHPRPKCDNWIYADYEKVKAWAATEPTEFIHVLKPLI